MVGTRNLPERIGSEFSRQRRPGRGTGTAHHVGCQLVQRRPASARTQPDTGGTPSDNTSLRDPPSKG